MRNLRRKIRDLRNVWTHGVTELREGERKTERDRDRERFRKPRYFIFKQKA